MSTTNLTVWLFGKEYGNATTGAHQKVNAILRVMEPAGLVSSHMRGSSKVWSITKSAAGDTTPGLTT